MRPYQRAGRSGPVRHRLRGLIAGTAAAAALLVLAGGDGAAPGRVLPAEAELAVAAPAGLEAAVPSGTPSVSASLGVRPGRAGRGGSGARLRPVDAGTGYYARFADPLPSSASFFPVAVWFESVLTAADTVRDRDAGINTYLELTENSDLAVVRAAGMHAIHSGGADGAGRETAGWLVSDETDMWAGPGDARWTGRYPAAGPVCDPPTKPCGYSVLRDLSRSLPADRRLRYTNYGKGVTFWQTRPQAARFVNEFQDVVSADNYWFTDRNICGAHEGGALFSGRALPARECHRAANYGRTIDKVRSLVSPPGSKPVWAFVEVGHPASENDWPSVTPAQVTAAVWSSLIHGARGVVYFNHSFGGPCPTQHALREDCYRDVRAAVRRLNARIRALAPVLNAPVAQGVTTAGPGIDVVTKWYDGRYYLLAGANGTGRPTVRFSLPCVGDAQVTVLDEGRTLTLAGGGFTDRFADSNAVHLYRIDGGSSCGAY